MSRTPDTPKGSLGLPVAPIRAAILDPDTGDGVPARASSTTTGGCSTPRPRSARS